METPALTDEEAGVLLAVARAAVCSAAARDPSPPLPSDLPPRLRAPAGAFVSLHRAGELRGCIGRVTPSGSLAEVVARMAEAAAHDPRLPPLVAGELGDLHVEVSVLSPVRRIAWAAIDPACHGVVLRLGRARALLLPQVARRYGWDRETLLAQLCVKAGLAPTAWESPAAELRAFTVLTVAGIAIPTA